MMKVSPLLQPSANHLKFTILGSLAFCWFGPVASYVSAETATQRYRVLVTSRAEVVAPSTALVVKGIDKDEQTLPAQSWELATTSQSGMFVEFSVDKAFQHHSNLSKKRDASLVVRIAESHGNGKWESRFQSDATDHRRDDEKAAVSVASSSSGSARVELVVGLADSGDPPSGRYSTTVFCTIATP